ncbi:hypothetical protein [Lacticaseibacillus nasuensis]|uniref:hypothetical protein n=1 Tax=Lacticaseibacillus nasuensis TaxID=944671 RepID=UPI0006D06353|nr:hypothetical protein [Lacticaseibacillus nasuensis]
MAKTDSLFGATYQQSRQIFSLDNLKDGGGFGQAGRVELRYRVWILLSVGMFFSVMIWMFGSELGGMATDAAAHPAMFITLPTVAPFGWAAAAGSWCRCLKSGS